MMTIPELLERLYQQRDSIDAAISAITKAAAITSTRSRADEIIKSIPKPRKKKHWTQKKEYRLKLKRVLKQMRDGKQLKDKLNGKAK